VAIGEENIPLHPMLSEGGGKKTGQSFRSLVAAAQYAANPSDSHEEKRMAA